MMLVCSKNQIIVSAFDYILIFAIEKEYFDEGKIKTELKKKQLEVVGMDIINFFKKFR